MRLDEKQKELVLTMYELRKSETFDLNTYEKYQLIEIVKLINEGTIFEINSITRIRLNEARTKYINNILKK